MCSSKRVVAIIILVFNLVLSWNQHKPSDCSTVTVTFCPVHEKATADIDAGSSPQRQARVQDRLVNHGLSRKLPEAWIRICSSHPQKRQLSHTLVAYKRMGSPQLSVGAGALVPCVLLPAEIHASCWPRWSCYPLAPF